MQTITVYTATFCSYCKAAKTLLNQLNLAFEEVNLDNQDELRQRLSAENNGYRTVPMIYIGKEFIGGYNELQGLHTKGQLLARVQA